MLDIEKIDRLIRNSMQEYDIPGLAISLFNEGKVIHSRGFGAKDYSEQIPCDEDTLFGVGSISKSFTCLAIMQLAEAGKLEIDDPISKYLDFRLGEAIKIRHLMTHSSGIPCLHVLSSQINIITNRDYYTPFVPISSKQDFMDHVNGAQAFVIGPEDRFFYFNEGFTLLGHIIEKVSGKAFDQYIKEHILDPLGMTRSGYNEEQFYSDPNYSLAYRVSKNGNSGNPHPNEEPPTFHQLGYAAGGLFSSVMEMTKYVQMYLNDGVYGPDDTQLRIARKESLDQMTTVQFSNPSMGVHTEELGQRAYGFGWGVYNDVFGEKLVMHGGSMGVFSAQLGFFPELKLGFAIASNQANIPMSLTLKLTGILLGHNPCELPGIRYLYHLKRLEGVYTKYRGYNSVEVKKMGGHLLLETRNPQAHFVLLPKSEGICYQFYSVNELGGKLDIEFRPSFETVVNSNVEKKIITKISLFLERNHYIKSLSDL